MFIYVYTYCATSTHSGPSQGLKIWESIPSLYTRRMNLCIRNSRASVGYCCGMCTPPAVCGCMYVYNCDHCMHACMYSDCVCNYTCTCTYVYGQTMICIPILLLFIYTCLSVYSYVYVLISLSGDICIYGNSSTLSHIYTQVYTWDIEHGICTINVCAHINQHWQYYRSHSTKLVMTALNDSIFCFVHITASHIPVSS